MDKHRAFTRKVLIAKGYTLVCLTALIPAILLQFGVDMTSFVCILTGFFIFAVTFIAVPLVIYVQHYRN